MEKRLLSQLFQQIQGEGVSSSKEGLIDDSPKNRIIDLASGIPDAGVLPYDRILQISRQILQGSHSFAALSYSDFAGIQPLRRQIAQLRGVNETNVFITNGAMQGIYLSAQALVDAGDEVLVENPVFPEGERIFQLAGASVDTLNVTEDDSDLDELERRLKTGRRYKAFYTVPDFQNPTGRVAHASRKQRLIDLANHYGFAVVADNPYRDLWFQHAPAEFPHSYRVSATDEHLFEIGSFSKILGPGWRLGWIIASDSTVRVLTSLRRSIDGHPSGISQYIVSGILDDDMWFENLLRKERKLYASKASVLYNSLKRLLGEEISMAKPEGGYFQWIHCSRGIDASSSKAAKAFDQQGVRIIPGTAFTDKRNNEESYSAHASSLRLAFSHSSPQDLIEGAERLARAIRSIGDPA